MYDCYLGVDIGTSGAKAVLWDKKSSQFILRTRETYSNRMTEFGWITQDANEVFEAILKILCEAIEKIKETPPRKSVCVVLDSALHSLLFLDHHLDPLTGIIPWIDERAASIAEEFLNRNLQSLIHKTTGCPIDSTYPLYKVAWFARNEPDLVEHASKVASIKEYVFHRLTGHLVTDTAVASGTGYFDVSKRKWAAELFEEITGVGREKLPELVSPHQILHLQDSVKKFLGAEEMDIEVMIGISDAAASSIGTIGDRQGVFTISIGTSAAVRTISKEPFTRLPDSNLWCYSIDETHWIIGGAMKNGGCVLDWYLNTFLNSSEYEIIEEHLASQGLFEKKPEDIKRQLLFLPLVFGQRFPHWSRNAAGAFIGMRGTMSRSHLTAAVVQGIAFNIKRTYQAVCSYFKTNPKEIVITGGLSQSRYWMRLLASVLGKALKTRYTSHDAAVGCVVFAEKGNWRRKLEELMPNVEEIYVPNDEEKDAYSELYDRWLEEMKDLERRDKHVHRTFIHPQQEHS